MGKQNNMDHNDFNDELTNVQNMGGNPEDAEQYVHQKNRALLLKLLAGTAAIVVVAVLLLVFVSGHFKSLITLPVLSDSGSTEVSSEESSDVSAEESAGITEEEAKEHVFAHRGTGGSEDTFESFDSMVAQGAKYIEQDVVLAGSVLFVSHDKMSYEEATAAGKVRLEDVFDRYGTDVTYVVELKTRDDETVREFARLVKEYGYQDNVIAQCFRLDVLKKVKRKLPDVKTLYLCDDKGGKADGHGGQSAIRKALKKDYVDIISVSNDDGLMTKKNCDRVHNADKEFSAWVLDEESSVDAAIEMGLDNYFTRYPEMAIEEEKAKREK